jgi:mono/diheme cytochrome c family protein
MKAIRGFTIRRRPLREGGVVLVSLLLGSGMAPTAARAEQAEVGSSVFKTYCASCHGAEAKGDGPLAQQMRTVPPDLTKVASRNKGKFDAEAVARIIDGRKPVKGHGGPDMPVWGDSFKQSRDGYSEDAVKARIAALVEFLGSIQAP